MIAGIVFIILAIPLLFLFLPLGLAFGVIGVLLIGLKFAKTGTSAATATARHKAGLLQRWHRRPIPISLRHGLLAVCLTIPALSLPATAAACPPCPMSISFDSRGHVEITAACAPVRGHSIHYIIRLSGPDGYSHRFYRGGPFRARHFATTVPQSGIYAIRVSWAVAGHAGRYLVARFKVVIGT
jgi:hypothetical protein